MPRKRAGRRQRRSPPATIEVTLVQVFPPTVPLPSNPLVVGEPHGIQREDAVRRRAAMHFSPAFVFRVPDQLKTGSGNRERGDGLIVVANRVIVLQVKARQPDKTDASPRAASWIAKESKKAVGQAKGTVSKLRKADEPIALEMIDPYAGLEPLRLHLEPDEAREYFGVVVIDHSSDEAEVAPLDLTGIDFPLARMRLDEWDYIVSKCDTATELWRFLKDHGANSAGYRQQRNAFAESPIGAKFQPFPVDRGPFVEPGRQPGVFVGAYELPEAALYSPAEDQTDRSFRRRIFGCLLNEVLRGASEASVKKALALLDGLSAEVRRGHERVRQEQLAECKERRCAAVITTIEEGAHLVEVTVMGTIAENGVLVTEQLEAAKDALAAAGGGTLVFLATEVRGDETRVHAQIHEHVSDESGSSTD